MAAALNVVRSLFAAASPGDTGIFFVRHRPRPADPTTSTSRLELEQGYVHAMSGVSGLSAARGEDALLALLAGLPDEAEPAFQGRPPRGPLLGQPVAAFHPARTLRRHVEAHAADRPGLPPSDEALLTLSRRPHASAIDGAEALLVALLDRPRHYRELVAAAPRLLVERLARFLEAVGALAIEDPVIEGAWALLGLPVGAPPEQIKRAWRQLARDLHPDLHAGASDEAERSARFQQVSAAYRRLLPGG